MNSKLKQARKGQTALVNANRQDLSIVIAGDPADPWSATTPGTFSGSISHERSIVPELNPSGAGLSTNLQRFLSVEYDVDFLKKGDIITDQNSKQWKLGAVDPLESFGGIHGYVSSLTEAV